MTVVTTRPAVTIPTNATTNWNGSKLLLLFRILAALGYKQLRSPAPERYMGRTEASLSLTALLGHWSACRFVKMLGKPIEHPLPVIVEVGRRTRAPGSVPTRGVVHPHYLLL